MMKGYLTLFLSLSLSILSGFLLLLMGYAIRNADKVRLERVADAGMNSALAEFNIALHERYDLLYVDVSYSGKAPSVPNLENRLAFYMSANLPRNGEKKPWGSVSFRMASVLEIDTAAEGKGNSMKNQAVQYIQSRGIVREEADGLEYLDTITEFLGRDAAKEWSGLQGQIAEMELPQIENEYGEWEEVPLGNPADGIFALLGSDVLYLLNADVRNIGVGRIQKESYISERGIQNDKGSENKEIDEKAFLTYLFEKMGNYRAIKEDSLLQYQLEYILQGKASDYENLKAVAEQLMQWRFACNASYALENAGLYAGAAELAEMLQAVQLKMEFKEPVTRSILYACAYLETIAEVKRLLEGGRIEAGKSRWQTKIEQVLSGEIPASFFGESGLSYGQCLACMLMLLDEEIKGLRCMDIMEMDIRYVTGNIYFAMDWCVESFYAQILAENGFGGQYVLNRSYGYY